MTTRTTNIVQRGRDAAEREWMTETVATIAMLAASAVGIVASIVGAVIAGG